MVKSQLNIQDAFLNQSRRDRVMVSIHLVDGKEIVGRITAFDSFTVIITNDEKNEQHLAYKHAIATICPASRVKWNHSATPMGPGGPAPGGRGD